MKKISIVLAIAFLLLVPALVLAQPPGCSWEGDPALRYGWKGGTGNTHNGHQPGPDTLTMYRGLTYAPTGDFRPYMYAAHATWLPAGICRDPDTFCVEITDQQGWTIVGGNGVTGPLLNHWDNDWCLDLPAGYGWRQNLSITCPCDAVVDSWNRVIIQFVYVNHAFACDASCLDCNDPNTRPSDGLKYYSADTLWIHVVTAPPAGLVASQDTVTLVDEGQTAAYIPFTITSPNPCSPVATAGYRITSKGHVGPAIDQSGTTNVAGGKQVDVYGIIDAGVAVSCNWDTLRIVIWNTADIPPVYDTCVQRIHVIEPEPVPLFTVPVVTILVLALILAAAVFMRRRAVSRA